MPTASTGRVPTTATARPTRGDDGGRRERPGRQRAHPRSCAVRREARYEPGVGAFDKAWTRATSAASCSSDLPRQAPALHAVHHRGAVVRCTTALRDADAMLGRLLAQVDPGRAAVMVVGPSEGRRKLTVPALRTPGSSPGYIRTASSQHDGVAIAVDVGPTLLDLFGIDFTDKMEGRPYEIVPSSVPRDSLRTVHRGSTGINGGERLAPMTAILVGLIATSPSPRCSSSRWASVSPPPPGGSRGSRCSRWRPAEHAARPVDTGWHRRLRRLPLGRGRNSRRSSRRPRGTCPVRTVR